MEQSVDRRTFLSILGAGSLSVLLASGWARAAEKPPMAGALLIAKIRTPPFHDSVVLLFEYGNRGAQGLIINKTDNRSLGRLMAQINLRFRDRPTFERYAEAEVLFGGPVGRGRVLSLIHTPPGKWARSWNLGIIAVTQDPELLREMAAGTAEVKQVVGCLGVSGWAPGQLEGEIAKEHWRVVYPDPKGLPGLLFETPLCDRLELARDLPEGLPVSLPRNTI